MRTSILAIVIAAAAGVTVPAAAQNAQQQGKSEQQMQKDQNEADKGVKTRQSGESGYVGEQEKPGVAAHPPGQPETTTGSTSTGTGEKPR
jgi:hypothetical protein